MAIQPDTVGMVVHNMADALAFYRIMGLEIAEGQADEAHVEVTTPNGYTIGFDAEAMVRQIDPDWQDGAGQRIALQFKCDSPAEVDDVYQRLMAAGYTSYKAPWDAFWDQRFARVRDPDGNVVSFFAPL
ncbi:MAG: VOC family protein [Roseiflexaceae bacterium]|nr:VOC family protein [Roseiflexaceae bacterium]